MERGQAKTTDNSEYLAFVRQNYLNRLKGHLPKTVLDKTSWLPPPAVLAEVQRSTDNKPETLHLVCVLTHRVVIFRLLLPDVRNAPQASLPPDGEEVCERYHTPEKSAGNCV